ncbi:hypothetical protein CHGG_05998 [Chaetomium globosum CBS 148.51]|uniref:HCNGP-like protein n=1 Tax=Chaetomium globosum (strain ATCC 6205 / CBS 148.51 / DSM 1962 / NBRC 6347 / NRRL 1970) TaxID=306901 RepID=Q2H5R7_CHAGB|nr:uncharacterized protein CHGG_05998 [Chaetomium globosum CBS 148.51]EAQ89379.1 hypothetical protein CHGG_05998 [Chaetomium globosum CBS 148.51]
MTGLVQYDSSDEDEGVQTPVDVVRICGHATITTRTTLANRLTEPEPTATSSSTPTHPPPPAPAPVPTPALGPVLGPTLGPSRPPPPKTTTNASDQKPQAEQEEAAEEIDLAFLSAPDNTNPSQRSPSPYTRTRTLLHNLTLPAVPNMDIPASPPGSPPPGLDALTAKFDTFLRLKRTRGVHFNERLARSAGMANPAVVERLLGFVGVGTEFGGEGGEDGDVEMGGGGGGGEGEGLVGGAWSSTRRC